ncbi:HAMP domain-containing sensor histidine kinase [Rurimicrobium arvi]|uniref:histidine kinase n=2 Tax=Rurimicrobium arvi TaxID=2049916 RepID=A0ABP8MF74_9BACT
MKRNMKRNAILICALTSVVLWILASYTFVTERKKLEPQSLTALLQKDILDKEQSVAALLRNHQFTKRLWTNTLSEKELTQLNARGIVVRIYDSSGLLFWSRNDFPVKTTSFLPNLQAIQEDNLLFLYQSFGKAAYPSRRMNLVIPVFRRFETSNEYLHSGFFASEDIPESSQLSLTAKSGFTPVRGTDGLPLFHIKINKEDIKPFVPGGRIICLCLLAVLMTVVTLHLMALHLARIYNALLGAGTLLLLLTIVSGLIFKAGLPFHLGNLELFSPRLYASSTFLPSFGHLLIHVCGFFWVLYFLHATMHTYDKDMIAAKLHRFRWLLTVLMIMVITFLAIYIQYLHQSMIFDSDISFDTNTVRATDQFTILALVICVLLARAFMYILYCGNYILGVLVQPREKYVLIFIVSIMCLMLHYFFLGAHHPWIRPSQLQFWFDIFAALWALGYIYFLDIRSAKGQHYNSSLFSLIFISVYFSILFAVCFKLFIDQKEQNITRLAFAERLARMQDTEMEIRFDEVQRKISADTVLQQWLVNRDSVTIADLYKHFKLFNSDIYFTRYGLDVYLFDQSGAPLIPGASVPLDSFTKIKGHSSPTLNPYLYFRADSSERGSYLALVPIRKDSLHALLGYLAVNFRLKQNIVLSLYPRLLKDQTDFASDKEVNYDYAIYINGKLSTRAGDYNFDYRLPSQHFEQSYVVRQQGDYSMLYYRAAPNVVYLVAYRNNLLLGMLTLFSFLFGISLVLFTLESWTKTLAKIWLFNKPATTVYNASMSVRVKYFALGFTAVSFFVIGLSTVIFLTNRYQSNSLENLKGTLTNVSEAVNEYLSNQKVIDTARTLEHELAQNEELAYFLTSIAQQQKIDINIFGMNGRMVFTTQEKIYLQNVLDPLISPIAFQELHKNGMTEYLQQEQIGSLVYTAGYAVISDDHGKAVGFLNIPSFYTKKRLDEQIMSLITTLLNIYTILLLISSVITFLFINTLTRSLNLVANSLRNVNLKSNELIHWPYDDEIGLLVNEYNKMVATVERNARSLVLDERQSAWREMAQQVAHEIKNPLTPMKLNIQYLQQAINSNHPDIINLTKRVSSSIIEQIDNLNYIASEFSNFAKMPENKTERIDIKSMLERIVLLFSGNKDLTVTHSFPEGQVIVFADHSQMLRIFTNIVQNAAEAMLPADERHGQIDIRLSFSEDLESISVIVKDNGSGIPENVKDKIFDPYFTTKSSGTGLGLAMTKKIIELWGGTIRFESVSGEGTTFFIELPLG